MNRLTQSRKRRRRLKVLVAHGSPSVGLCCGEAVGNQRGVRLTAVTTSAAETLREAARSRPDVIFLRTRLRGANGVELLLALKRRLPAAFVVMVSERSGAPVQMKFLAAGADLFIGRPAAMHQVPIILRHLTRGSVKVRSAADRGPRIGARPAFG